MSAAYPAIAYVSRKKESTGFPLIFLTHLSSVIHMKPFKSL